jgi:transcriptional regulator with XRE-family HTH domain
MTQHEFAAAVGVSQPTVSDWLNRETRPAINKLPIISKVTGISIEDLVGDISSPPPASDDEPISALA